MSNALLNKLAKPMLFAAAIIWGAAFVVMKNAIEVLPVNYLLAIRFFGGAILLALVFWKQWKTLQKTELYRGMLLGVLLYLAFSIQTYGLYGTTPSKNSFLTATYCVLVPFLYWIATKVRPDIYHIAAAFLCVAGVGLVSLNESLTITWGDWLTLLCAVFYAAHIVSVAKLSKGYNIFLMTVIQFATAAVISLVMGLLFETAPTIAVLKEASVPLIYLTVCSTAGALLFQNVGQAHCDNPTSAAMILSTEAVFGVLSAVLFYDDKLTLKMLAGFALIFLAIVCSETKFSFLRKKPAAAIKES